MPYKHSVAKIESRELSQGVCFHLQNSETHRRRKISALISLQTSDSNHHFGYFAEVKNHKGLIRGDASDQELIQDRGRGDRPEDKLFYNPVKQVTTHAYRLEGYLRSKNLPIHIRTCVFFVNPDSQLQLHDSNGILREKCPVFHVNQVKKVLRYLQSGLNQLSGREFDQSVKLLEQLMK